MGLTVAGRGIGRILAALLPLAAGIGPAAAAEDPLYAWVQLGPDNSAQARAVMPAGGACPEITIDGQIQPMRLRAPADPADAFAVNSCQAVLPPGAVSLSVGGLSLPVPRGTVRRIAVIGDTGCRIKKHHVQDCDDPAAWPFPAIAEAVAAARPDLVIHVGDYLYRESPCPEDEDGCAGSNWGYNWETWEQDFLAPAAPLLAQAPLLPLRGNHETCGRAWRGWYRFLAEADWTPDCQDYSAPYAVNVEGRRLVLLDSTHADDKRPRQGQVQAYAALLHTVNDLAAGAARSWLVTHKPFWSIGKVAEDGAHPRAAGDNAVLRAAAAGTPLAPGIDGILSGHVHLFQALSFAGDAPRPHQLILGNGGTSLASAPAELPPGLDAWGMAPKNFFTVQRFGFAMLEPAGETWRLTLHDPFGAVFAQCDLAPFDARCTSLP